MSSNVTKNHQTNFNLNISQSTLDHETILSKSKTLMTLDNKFDKNEEIINDKVILSQANCFNGSLDKLNDVNRNANDPIKNDVTNNSSKQTKVERIQDYIYQCLSDKSKKKISSMINNVIELNELEKVYFALNLPTSSSNMTNNGKGPNPFSKKADIEISQTYIWIASHLEEDSSVSLPKQEVYDEYKLFCESNETQPLCVADFGKAMKHMFPNVKPRRLGQRGNSRYCYSGLRKKINFDKPQLPDLYEEMNRKNDLDSTQQENAKASTSDLKSDHIEIANQDFNDQRLEERLNMTCNDPDLILSASSSLILEWASKLLNLNLTSIKDLAKHLISSNYINKESMAALTVITSDLDLKDDFNQLSTTLNSKLDKKNLENLKSNKTKKISSSDSMFKKLTSSLDKKDKSSIKKKNDKDDIKLVMNRKSTIDQLESTVKMPKVLKTKKTKFKKDKTKLTMINKIKLESFDSLTTRLVDNVEIDKSNSITSNPIEISETKNSNLEQLETNQFIKNTQFDLNLNNTKRRHSTIGFNRMIGNQSIENSIDNSTYKYQMKRQTSELSSTAKKRNPIKFNSTSISLLDQSNNFKKEMSFNYYPVQPNQQSTTYFNEPNEPNAKTNNNQQLVSFKKYFDFDQQTKLNENLASTQQSIDNGNNDNNISIIQGPQPLNTTLNPTIATQVNESELYSFDNNLYDNSNQVSYINTNHIFTSKQNQLTNYNNETQLNMCNVNTQIPSIPASPINQKENTFATQFSNQSNNLIINDKVDFNNNLPSSGYSSFNEEQRIQQMNNCQINQSVNSINNQFNNHMNNRSNSQQPKTNPLFSVTHNNNRTLNRVRHSSGPSIPYNPVMYTNNAFLTANNGLTNVRSNSLSPLYENCVDSLNNHKLQSNDNFTTNSSIKFFNPVSPASEPMSPNVESDDKKKIFHNLRFNHKFNNLNQIKRDGSRSFTGSNSSEPFVFANRTRHMSSPFIGNAMYPQSNLEEGSFLTHSPTTPFNTNEVFLSNNSINSTIPINSTGLNHSTNLNSTNLNQMQDSNNYLTNSIASNYDCFPSPPLTSNINEDKFKNQSLIINQPVQFSTQQDTIQEFSGNCLVSNEFDKSVTNPIDDLQATFHDLKSLDNDFSKFF